MPIINIIAGLWAILSGLFIVLSVPANFIITGAVIAVFGFLYARSWQGVLNGFLGVWLFISAFFPQLTTPVNFLIVGLVVFAVAIWRMFAPERGTPQGRVSQGRVQPRPGM